MSEKSQRLDHRSKNRWLDIIGAVVIVTLTVIAAFWIGGDMAAGELTVWHVLIAATITAIATGFGAFPFLFIEHIGSRWLGIGNAIAAGLMLGASIGLLYEGAAVENVDNALLRLIIGAAIGFAAVIVAHHLLEGRSEEFSIGKVQGANAIQMLMIVGIMTAHSFAEGIGVGVSYGEGETFGLFISIAIAIHNIPEGLAISLILIPRGTSVLRASLWSMFSSLPQPIMAVPAFLFVLAFRPFLPVGLGLAAGAMIWMVFHELLPEALEDMPRRVVYPIAAVAVVAMLLFQILIG